MNTDFTSLERRYGTGFALKLVEEIARAEQAALAMETAPSLLQRPSTRRAALASDAGQGAEEAVFTPRPHSAGR